MQMTADTTTSAEAKIRAFLGEELMKDWASTIQRTEQFQLDSIDQVDLRVFLEDTFSVRFVEGQKPFQDLQSILDLINPSPQ